jgi:tetratricopeptide (TPR) repeat protein
LAVDPNFAVAASNLAWVYAQQGTNLDVALGLAQRAKQLMPELPSITDTLAWVIYKKGVYVSALPLLQECVEKEPGSAMFHYHLGLTYLGLGEKAKGKVQMQTALRLKLPKNDADTAEEAIRGAH